MDRLSAQHFDACIAELSSKAPQMAFARVPAGICAFWAESLGWPEWLCEGTAFAGATKLPRRIMLVDDLRIVANLIENVGEARLVEMIFEWDRFPGDAAVVAAPDLGSALRFLIRNVDAANPPIALRLDTDGNPGRVSVTINPRIKPFARVYEEVLIAVIFKVVRAFLGLTEEGREAFSRISVGIAHSSEDFAQRLGWPVIAARGDSFVAIPRDALACENPSFTLELWEGILGRSAALPRTRADAPLSSVEAVEATLRAALFEHGRVMQFAEIARSLDRSERSLARDLARAGISYRTLVDRVRMSKAQELLLHGGLAVNEVAERLGYSEVSAFVRSFRRHFGVSPGCWRRDARDCSHLGRDAAA